MSIIRLKAGVLPADIEALVVADAIDPYGDEVMQYEAWAGSFNTDTAEYWPSLEADDTTRVWLTPSDRWVMTTRGRDCYLTVDQARDWLTTNGYRDAVAKHIDVEHGGRGRPEVGPEVKTRLPQAVIDTVDVLAARSSTSRAAQIRTIVMDTIALT